MSAPEKVQDLEQNKVIVTDRGFAQDDPMAGLPAEEILTLPSDTDPHAIAMPETLGLIRVEFPSFADGRGFTIGRILRERGYRGHLRATGHVIADQYAMARRSGFDDVEISADLAARQPEDQWLFRANWQKNDYQSRLRRG